MTERVATIRGTSSNKYHRVIERRGEEVIACRYEEADSLLYWDRDEADVWRAPCRNPECYGPPRSERADYRGGSTPAIISGGGD